MFTFHRALARFVGRLLRTHRDGRLQLPAGVAETSWCLCDGHRGCNFGGRCCPPPEPECPMRCHDVAVVVAMILASGCVASPATATGDDHAAADSVLTAILTQRKAAYGQSDRTAWSRGIADSSVCADAIGVAHFGCGLSTSFAPQEGWKLTAHVADLRIVHFGDAAVLTYVETDSTRFGDQVIANRFRYLDTYQRQGDAWKLIATSETRIPLARTAVQVSPARLRELVGVYGAPPGSLWTVTLEGERLMAGVTGQEKGELLAESDSTFFGTETQELVTFTRDAARRVTALVYRDDRQAPQGIRFARQP